MGSVLSALGTLVTPVRLDLARGALCRLSAIDWNEVGRVTAEMRLEGRGALLEAGLPEPDILYDFSADMRYFGQQSEVTVRLEGDPMLEQYRGQLRSRFDEAYESLYGVRLDEVDVEVVSWRVAAHGGAAERDVGVTLESMPGRPRTRRQVHFRGRATTVDVFDRSSLARDQRITGPVLIEERETTVYV